MLVAGIILLRLNSVSRMNVDSVGIIHLSDGWRYVAGSGLERAPGSLSGFVQLLMLMSGLGIALAIRQFLIPFYSGEWGFLLHRPVQRKQVLLTKLAVAALLGLPPALIWVACWLTVQIPGWYSVPTPAPALICGLILLVWGVVAYCTVVDVVLLHNIKPWRWIKGSAIATTTLFFVMFCLGMKITASETLLIQGGLLLLFLATIGAVFLTREF